MNLNDTFAAVQAASRRLALLPDEQINRILNAVADAVWHKRRISFPKTGKTWIGCHPTIRNTTG